jgi:hypothetical protein
MMEPSNANPRRIQIPSPLPKPERAFDCTSCQHFEPANAAQRQNGGVCHRMPPTPIMVGFVGGRPQVLNYFPLIGKGDWCSEHSASQLSALVKVKASLPDAATPGRQQDAPAAAAEEAPAPTPAQS